MSCSVRQMFFCLSALLVSALFLVQPAQAQIGKSLGVHDLASGDSDVVGVAFDEVTSTLFTLQPHSRKVYRYSYDPSSEELTHIDSFSLKISQGALQGLAFGRVAGKQYLFVSRWFSDTEHADLCRVNITQPSSAKASCLSLSRTAIGVETEPHGVTYHGGKVYVGYETGSVHQGIVRLSIAAGQDRWTMCRDNALTCKARHLPNGGKTAYGLGVMAEGDEVYLWGTRSGVYLAEASTGRGLFTFAKPGTSSQSLRGLAFGAGVLWVPERLGGTQPDRIHRVNVLDELDVRETTPWQVREWAAFLYSRYNGGTKGVIRHNFALPFTEATFPNQDQLSFKVKRKGEGGKYFKVNFYTGGDSDTKMRIRRLRYLVTDPTLPINTYINSEVRYTAKTRRARMMVYPHLVNSVEMGGMASADYTSDDAFLYGINANINDYALIVERIDAYIKDKYGISDSRMDHPYWAARNAVEYIVEHYYYPTDGLPAVTDPNNGIYNNNPAYFKVSLSEGDYDTGDDVDAIMSCSAASVTLDSIMRYLGFSSRWIGSMAQKNSAPGDSFWCDRYNCEDWTTDGLLKPGQWAKGNNGHRWIEVWLGDLYGWQRFDATPENPVATNGDLSDFDVPPPMKSQKNYMDRCASDAGHARRLITTVGSGQIASLVTDSFDQRYNLTAKHTQPDSWGRTSRVYATNPLSIDSLDIETVNGTTTVSWELVGDWAGLDPDATLVIYGDNKVLAYNVPFDAGSTQLSLSTLGNDAENFDLKIVKTGDSQTGGIATVIDGVVQ